MARKRSNGEGAIFKNEARDRWQAALVVGYTDDGKPIRRAFTAKTRKAVAEKLDAARSALDQGLDIPDNKTTVSAFTTWWLENVLPGEGLAPATERWYSDILAVYVLPSVGSRTLTGPKALTPADVQALTGKLARSHSHRVADASRTALGKVLRAAEARGLVGRNVARLAPPPGDSGKARRVKACRVDEVTALLAAVDGTRWHPVVVVAITTGLRPGELLALHWADLHLTGNEPRLSVRHAVSHVSGAALKAPKRQRSYRTVPLVPEAVAALKAWRKAQAAERLRAGELWSADWPDLAFTNEAGEPQRVDTYRHSLANLIDRYNARTLQTWLDSGRLGSKPQPLARITPHQARHTYATHLLEAGAPIHHVAELLGDSVATVEATYSHVLRPKHEVAAIASGLVGGGAS